SNHSNHWNRWNRWINRTVPAALLALVAPPTLVDAASPDYCAPTVDMDPLQLLRQTSLDLRGHVPSYEEYELVRGADDPAATAEGLIAEMLESEDYFDQVRNYHQALIWGTLDSSIIDQIYAGQRRLSRNAQQNWRLGNMARQYRGDQIDCLDQLQTQFDAQDRPIPIQTYDDPVCTGGTCQQEGYVMVAPYWDPANPIKVCAFDAQEAANGATGACSVYHTNDAECGCGPNLQWCGPISLGLDQVVRDSLAEEPARVFEWVVRESRSYLEAFTTDTTFVNGPVSHFYRHNSGTTTLTLGGAVSYEVEIPDVPVLPFDDTDTWVETTRGGPHAGVFTTMGYLIRFASNRARANRFATAFYCEPFVPKEDGLPPEEAEPSPNLRERAGCNDCHERLEPLAAHWGRWRTGGTYGFFRPEELSFTEPRPDCICGEGIGNCSAFCSTYFVTADNSGDEEFGLYQGLPQAASWLEGSDVDNVEAGPMALIDTDDERDRIAQCAVRNLGEHLLGRELTADDLTWLQGHAQAFADDGYDYTSLVRRLVQDERYRTIR
ncbi:MAG: hypothetical protein KDK70_19850, partial [Myxococcales bacterium]|nr:hypothetical protein [Myxococcales bacterium]